MIQKLRRLLRWYAIFGAGFALPVWCSFTLPVLFTDAPVTMAERLIGALAVQPAALVSALVRFVFWAPSLVLWAFAPADYTFGLWLLPGYFAALAMGVH